MKASQAFCPIPSRGFAPSFLIRFSTGIDRRIDRQPKPAGSRNHEPIVNWTLGFCVKSNSGGLRQRLNCRFWNGELPQTDEVQATTLSNMNADSGRKPPDLNSLPVADFF